MKRFKTLVAALVLAALTAFNAQVQAEVPFAPGVSYNPEVPDLEKVLGYKSGEVITAPADLIVYLKALHEYAPEQTRLVEYARSWEGRPLVYLVISSKANMARLDEIQANMQKLANPDDLTDDQQATLIAQTPPVSWLAYGVHGNEISSSDAALLTAYHLLAAVDDPIVDKILNDSVVVIDPSQNPDGRNRFVQHYQQLYGIEPALSPIAAEHREPWPGGRMNHYLFDMNRDWFGLTQPETIGRITHIQKFHPVVHVDLHEMGANSSYYFPPPANPYNPFITEQQQENLNLYGIGNAAAFDRFRFDYFTREVFDAYYPGYGDTWPGFHGAVGMTFEMASARGLAQIRDDGKVLTYRDGVHRHFVTSIATAHTTANYSDKLLNNYVEHRQSAIADRTQFMFAGGDPSLQTKLADSLVTQGIRVHKLTSAGSYCGHDYAAGSYVVQAGQPAGRLARTLLESGMSVSGVFWEEQERRREIGLGAELYDVLAWSLPALYNLDVRKCGSRISKLTVYQGGDEPPAPTLVEAQIGYIVPWGTTAAIKFVAAAMREGIQFRFVDAGFEFEGTEYPTGTLLVMVSDNDDGLVGKLTELLAKEPTSIIAMDSSWTASGINFGSNQVKKVTPPKIAIAWDSPASPYSAGNTRYVIERQFGYPTTPVRVEDLSRSELDQFDVLFIPDGRGYNGVLGEGGMKHLTSWVQEGGTLITVESANQLLMEGGMGLLGTMLEANQEAGESDEGEGLAPATIIDSEEDYQEMVQVDSGKPDYIPGVILKANLNRDHWLSGGVEDSINFMVTGSDIYLPLNQENGYNVASFAPENEILVDGYLWEENRVQMAFKPAVMAVPVGGGQVIAFTQDPAFRGFLDGLNVLLANALFFGPAH